MLRIQAIAGTNLLGATPNIVSGTFSSPNNAGNAIIVGLAYDAAAGGCTGISDVAGNSYTKVQASARQGCEVWVAQNIVQGTNNVVTGTLNFVDGQIFCEEWSGLIKASPFDVGAAGTGIGTAPHTPNTPTTSQANELAYAVVKDDSNAASFMAAGGYSNLVGGTSGFSSGASESQILTSTGVQAGTFTGGIAGNSWDCAVATFKGASSPSYKMLLGVGNI